MKFKITSLFTLIIISLLACKNAPDTQQMEADLNQCDRGKPQAIFSKDLPFVNEYSFEEQKSFTLETVQFDSLKLELVQSGCERLKQEFRFTLPETYENEEAGFWVDKSIWSMNYLIKTYPALMPLSGWVEAIAFQKADFVIGEPLQDEGGTYVLIDKIVQGDETLLKVELSE